jgi:hypothetical protein
VRLFFCGGCNPHIDREGVAAELDADEKLRASEVIVYISGCQRSCRAGQRLLLDTPGAIVVAGEHVDGTPVAASQIVARVRTKVGAATADGAGTDGGTSDDER